MYTFYKKQNTMTPEEKAKEPATKQKAWINNPMVRYFMWKAKNNLNTNKNNNMNDTQESQPERQMTFGEKLVGLNFNPSNQDNVSMAKKLCADLMDLLQEHRSSKETTELENILYDHAIGEILNAQMNVVKLLTFKG